MPDHSVADEQRETALSRLASGLRALPEDQFREEAVRFLAEPLDWPALLLDHFERISDDEIASGTRGILVDGVEPKTFLLHDDPGRFQVVLNHFDRDSFEVHRAAGRITPHFHRFSFATRVIHGHYHHLLFANSGNLEKPRLDLWHRTRDDMNDVYFLPWDEYHCVLAPEQGTMSLQVRGPVRYRPAESSSLIGTSAILHARDTAVNDLRTAASGWTSTAGHVPDFSHRWLDS